MITYVISNAKNYSSSATVSLRLALLCWREDRRRLNNKNKNFVICFVLSSPCTIFAGAKIGGGSEMKIKTLVFILHFSRLALSLQSKEIWPMRR